MSVYLATRDGQPALFVPEKDRFRYARLGYQVTRARTGSPEVEKPIQQRIALMHQQKAKIAAEAEAKAKAAAQAAEAASVVASATEEAPRRKRKP